MPSRYLMKRTIVTLGTLAASLPRLLSGQTGTPTLSLTEAHALALKNHPQVLASQALYQRADQITIQERSAYYPALNGEVTGAQATLNSRLGAGILNDTRVFNHLGSGQTL